MGYENIPSVTAVFPDGNLRTTTTSSQPRILILGSAPSGLSYELYLVTNVGAAETEFGSTSEVIQKLYEVIRQGSDNVSLMRIGGRQGSCVLATAGGTVTFTTLYRDEDILDRYSIVIENDGTTNRYLVWDNEDDSWVFDTDGEKVIDDGIIRVVESGTPDIMTIGDIDDPDTAAVTPALGGSDIVILADDSEANLTLVTATDGTDGTSMSLVERYAALNYGYQVLDFRDGDYVIPCNAYLDDANVVDGNVPDFTSVPIADSVDDALGYVWQYIYRGKLYTYFSESNALFSATDIARLNVNNAAGLGAVIQAVVTGVPGEAITVTVVEGGVMAAPTVAISGSAITVTADIAIGVDTWADVKAVWDATPAVVAAATCTLTTTGVAPVAAQGPTHLAWVAELNKTAISGAKVQLIANAAGVAGEAVTLTLVDTGGAGPATVTVLESAITIDLVGLTPTTAAIKVIYDAVPAATALATMVDTAPGVLTWMAGDAFAATALVLDIADFYFLNHNDLTGDPLPVAVATRFYTGDNAELREVNFAHQLASFCHNASTNWKPMIGFISTKAPTAYDRYTVSDWAGSLPEYTDSGEYVYIDAPADNGYGLLGNKFMAGKSITSNGYRSHLVTDGDSTDGYAYGGFILTKGESLPNAIPYGINSNDEEIDINGEPIDIGKFLFITYDYAILSNAYNGGTRYRGSIEAYLAGKFAVTDVRREPIGANGQVTGLSRPCHIRYPQINDLSGLRMIGLRREEGVGYILVSAHTAAHPDSDYTKLSTIRCVARTLNNVRTLCKRYLGEAFTSSVIASLNQSIESYLRSDRQEGYNNGAVHSLSYTNTDRILGRLTVYVKMVPPGSIESVTVSVSLAADETEL